jgi:flavin reductase (DIM6/NTAB) family NADH-FMN oxidoreductase RutF
MAASRINIGTQGFLYPMPMTLVGVDLPTGPNFMAIAWINRVEYNPPRLVAGLNKAHASTPGITQHGEFSVCIPSVDQVAVTDWCGIKSQARGVDKAAAFDIYRGELTHAPMIAQCPVCLECRVWQTFDIGTHDLIVADIVATWTEGRFLDESGKPDITRIRPFTLTMPDNRYWAVGEHIGDAWSIGRTFESPAK